MSDSQIEKILFVYTRGEEVKVLNYNASLWSGEVLLKSGWLHVGTIEPVLWIEAHWNLVESNTLKIEKQTEE
jgi:hypothetical protein